MSCVILNEKMETRSIYTNIYLGFREKKIAEITKHSIRSSHQKLHDVNTPVTIVR